MSIAYINGDFLPTSQAKLSVLDRGFLFADSLYEIIPAYNGHIRSLASHIDRLETSCDAIDLQLQLPLAQWQHICDTLIQQNEPDEPCHKIYLQITRGQVSHLSERRLHAPAGITPTIVALCTPYTPPTLEELSKGYHAITHEDIRRKHCHIKSTSLMANVLTQQSIDQQNADEAILIRDGYVTEGNSSNVFIVKNQQIITPPISDTLLSGITRQSVLAVAKHHGIDTLEMPIPQAQLILADEIWITSSTREIVPVVTLNGQPTGFDAENSLWRRMIELYRTDARRQGVQRRLLTR